MREPRNISLHFSWWRPISFVMAFAYLALTMLAPANPAHAYWSSAPVVVTVNSTAGATVAPVITCTTNTAGLLGTGIDLAGLLSERYAEITWPAVPHAGGYTVTVVRPSTGVVVGVFETDQTKFAMLGSQGLLDKVLGIVVYGVLVTQAGDTVTVQTKYGANWKSAASNIKAVRGPLPVVEVLAPGIHCAT